MILTATHACTTDRPQLAIFTIMSLFGNIISHHLPIRLLLKTLLIVFISLVQYAIADLRGYFYEVPYSAGPLVRKASRTLSKITYYSIY